MYDNVQFNVVPLDELSLDVPDDVVVSLPEESGDIVDVLEYENRSVSVVVNVSEELLLSE